MSKKFISIKQEQPWLFVAAKRQAYRELRGLGCKGELLDAICEARAMSLLWEQSK